MPSPQNGGRAQPGAQPLPYVLRFSPGLAASAVMFGWNAEGTELTITPNEYLEYGIGLEPATAVSKQYGYTISSGARDLAGNTLEQSHAVSFHTGRLIIQESPLVSQFSGSINKVTKAVSPNLGAGDDVNDDAHRAFVSFELPSVPEDRLDLLVVLETEQALVSPNVFSSLGALRVAAGSFDTEESLLAISMAPSLGVLTETPELGTREPT